MPITTLSKGYKKPSAPAYGDTVFPAMEENIQLMNDHTHNGTNGALIANTAQSVSSADWGSDLGGGTYRQLLTVPTGFAYDTARMQVRRSTGEAVFPTIERASSTTFYLYTNNNSISYTINYV